MSNINAEIGKNIQNEIQIDESMFANQKSDFTSCEYALHTGELLYHDGDLLSQLSLGVPENITTLCEHINKWILLEDQHKQMELFAEEVLKQNKTGSNMPCFSRFCLIQKGKRHWIGLSSQTVHGKYAGSQILTFFSMDKVIQTGYTEKETAEIDSLTGCLNRGALEKKVLKLIENHEEFAFVMIDVDGFKRLNDLRGHVAGDGMLKAFAQNIKNNLRSGDLFGRVGGDEFVACFRNIKNETEASELLKTLSIRTRWQDDVLLTTSMGISFSPANGNSFHDLYSKADIAMYCAKSRGGDGHLFYYEGMNMPTPGVFSTLQEKQSVSQYQSGLMITVKDGTFIYPDEIKEMLAGQYDHRPLWQILEEDGVTDSETAGKIHDILNTHKDVLSPRVTYLETKIKKNNGRTMDCSFGVVAAKKGEIQITITDISNVLSNSEYFKNIRDIDQLTGVLNMACFKRLVDRMVNEHPSIKNQGQYALLYSDINRFKAINDTFGSIEGDKLLMHIGKYLREAVGYTGAVARMGSDRFVIFIRKSGEELVHFVEDYLENIAQFPLPYEVVSNVGIYVTSPEELCVEAMIDRANIALKEIKGNYAKKYSFFNEKQRLDMLKEQEIVGMMTTALQEGQFILNYQPQFDHVTKKMIGAEALVRWMHPEKGLISPAEFIPIFERNGFISKLDMYVFEQVCKFQRKCMDQHMDMIAVSVNRTRYDIFQPDFVSSLEKIRTKYDVPAKYLHIEITETAIAGDKLQARKVIEQLHQHGYAVEMDDFGSGYSSLNTLKDIDLDVLKLDMNFLSEDMDNRGGTILSSVVRMAKWLGLPVIAEGVESIKQANYLRSIGCNYLQGYLYAKPMQEKDFHKLIQDVSLGEHESKIQLIETLNPAKFWNPESLETLIFSQYVGGAAIFDYYDGKIEILRVNEKYMQEIQSNFTSGELIRMDVSTIFDEENQEKFAATLQRAISSGDEEECETWRKYGDNSLICVRSNIRLIGKSESNYLFYEMIRNVTSDKIAQMEGLYREKRFRTASEQANIYYWEYDVGTKEMIPCFRCIRDLGLPPLVKNYPEPAIEMGIFPPEVAEIYREMHRKIEEGVVQQEICIPLTPDRVMFRVRYTTEFDENGKPIKAYGSATRV